MTTEITTPFWIRATGHIGQEIIGPDGTVIAWTIDRVIAEVIVRLLNKNDGLTTGNVDSASAFLTAADIFALDAEE